MIETFALLLVLQMNDGRTLEYGPWAQLCSDPADTHAASPNCKRAMRYQEQCEMSGPWLQNMGWRKRGLVDYDCRAISVPEAQKMWREQSDNLLRGILKKEIDSGG